MQLGFPPIPLPLRREPHPSAGQADPDELSPCGASPGRLRAPPSRTPPIMGSQSSKAPRGDVTAEEAAGTSPAKANGQVGALGTACPGPLLHTSSPLGPWAGAARFVRPGTRGAPSPARSLCSRRRSPRG